MGETLQEEGKKQLQCTLSTLARRTTGNKGRWEQRLYNKVEKGGKPGIV